MSALRLTQDQLQRGDVFLSWTPARAGGHDQRVHYKIVSIGAAYLDPRNGATRDAWVKVIGIWKSGQPAPFDPTPCYHPIFGGGAGVSWDVVSRQPFQPFWNYRSEHATARQVWASKCMVS